MSKRDFTNEELTVLEPGMEDFLMYKAKNITSSSLRTYKEYLGLVCGISPKPLLELTRSEAQRVALDISKKKSAGTIGTLIRMFYRYHDRDDLARCFKIRRKQKRIDPSEILTVDEVNALINATDNLRDRAIIAVLWETGGRIHEILSLKMENVRAVKNGDMKLYKVFFPKVKVSGQEHSCLLIEASSHLKAWLNSYALRHDRNAPLFPTFDRMRERRHLSVSGFRGQFRKAIRKCRLKKKIYPHLFRHSRATFLLKKGWPETIINQYMGWVPQSMMIGRYSHLADQDVDNKMYEMHGMKPVEAEDIGTLMEATVDEMSTSAPTFELPPATDIQNLLESPEIVRHLDKLIEARVAEKWGDWTTQVETGELSKAMDERTDKISIAVRKAVKEVDQNAVVESIEVSFPEVQKMQKK